MGKEIVESSNENSSLRDIFEPFVPLFQKFIDNKKDELKVKEQQIKSHSDYTNRLLDYNKHKFNRLFYLLVFIVVFICALEAGLIFVLKDTKTGILVLSHIGAIIAGLLTGLGIRHSQSGK